MQTFFFVFLHPQAPVPQPSAYFKRYAEDTEPRYTIATDVTPSSVPGMVRMDLAPIAGDIPTVLHLPIGHISSVVEVAGDKPPVGFNLEAKN